MKSVISLEIQNGNQSLVVFEHEGQDMETVCRGFELTPEVRKATVLVANLTGKIVTMNENDSARSVAQIAAW